jgi:methylase of polypeptide subunit release factors
MKYPSIRIEGAILSADILDKIEHAELIGQKPKDFGFTGSNVRVKDEIVKAWADAQDMWRIYKRKTESLRDSKTGTTETRNFWLIPLLGLLGYDVELYRKAEIVNTKTYAISHRGTNLDNFPIHIMGLKDSLDKKRQDSGPRMSPHALLQEYINLNEHLYAIVSNGITLRLLRDSSRLIKLSFVEFDLERMFEEEHFADFAIMFRLIHASRMPIRQNEGAESLIEGYHQDSLDSGSRIRAGLSKAVENSIKSVANGFLSHPTNDELRQAISDGLLTAKDFYQYQLRFIYRILFLMVIEERDLIFTRETPPKKKEIYERYYGVTRIRNLSEKRYLADKKHSDLWINLKNTFRLFEATHYGQKLDVEPLAGDLFGYNAIGLLNKCDLDNQVLLECFRNLTVFVNPNTGQKMRVNYASLNVEEFGSVYEGLLEYDPVIEGIGSNLEFLLVKGSERSATGSHYTPDELVQPLIKHSLDYIIEDKLKEKNPEKALLSITVCDVACGSGHILLSAARRIATELAKVRTGEDQPSPSAFRKGVRDVIRSCIYGVDINPLAVELCKVSLWLEAHNPGEPLNFLDHRIKCGDAIVGLAHKEELQNGISDEAFKKLPGDDSLISKGFLKRNKEERKKGGAETDNLFYKIEENLDKVSQLVKELNLLPERTPDEIKKKQQRYNQINNDKNTWRLRTLADIQVAQFFIPKILENGTKLVTDSEYRAMLDGRKQLAGHKGVAEANAIGVYKHFFHWFIEFPEVMRKEGFDCILGNPPFLGGQRISGSYGFEYLNCLIGSYFPAQSVDLVTFFFRRIFQVIKTRGFQTLIATNTIAQGKTRKGGLAVIQEQGGSINYAHRSMRWPGLATVEVSQVGIYKGRWSKKYILDNNKVEHITSYLDTSEELGDPHKLIQNKNKSYQGSIILGKGFILDNEKAKKLISHNLKNEDVVSLYLSAEDLNSRPDQSPSRWVVNFYNWDKYYCQKEYEEVFKIAHDKIKPQRENIITQKIEKGNKLGIHDKRAAEEWWLYLWPRPELYGAIKGFEKVITLNRYSKNISSVITSSNQVFSDSIIVTVFNQYYHIAILNSSIHDKWAWKYSSTMGTSTIRYSISNSFETFPFLLNQSFEMENELEKIGEIYHEFRRQLMLKIELGLTKTYNQFHNNKLAKIEEPLDGEKLQKVYGKETLYLWKHLRKTEGTCSFNVAVEDIFHLRDLHEEMDNLVLKAYGWDTDSDKWGPAINLEHDFHEVDYLPENDRIRYTISPQARPEVLKRLLKLNHEIYAEEVAQGLHDKKKGKKKAKVVDPDQAGLELE